MSEVIPLGECSEEIAEYILDNKIPPASFVYDTVLNKILDSGLNIPLLKWNCEIYCWCNYNRKWYLIASLMEKLNIFWVPSVIVEGEICTINYSPETFMRETIEYGKPPKIYRGEAGRLEDILCQLFVESKKYQVVFPKPVVKSRVSGSTKRFEGDVQLVTREYFEKRQDAISKMAEIGDQFGLTVNE